MRNNLRNRYYLMRHGRSRANAEGIILSDPRDGTIRWGLTEEGRKQIRKGVMDAMEKGLLTGKIIIFSSDFLRAWESAVLASELLDAEPPVREKRLRERYFGEYDKTSDDNYPLVWERDEGNGANNHRNVETPDHVRDRFRSLISDLENRFQGRDILLVSHGDALQIGQTWFDGKPSHCHRRLKHLETGEIRLMA